MTTLLEAAQMALDALEHLQTDIEWQYKSPTRAMLRKVEKALRAALAQPEQEPLAWMDAHDPTEIYYRKPPQGDVVPLYLAPPKEIK